MPPAAGAGNLHERNTVIDNDFDLDALLDDIAAEVTDLASENPYDRHDRLRQEFEDAEERARDAEIAMSRIEESVGEASGYGSGGYYMYRSLVSDEARGNTASYNVNRMWALDRALQGQDVFIESVTDDQVRRLLDGYESLKRAERAMTEARDAYQAACKDLDLAPIEGCYVRFCDPMYDQWGSVSNYTTGYGVITKITAASYIVAIDHAMSDRRMGDKSTARIATKNAFDNVYSRGRNMELLWGPTGNARRAERARLNAIKQAEEDRKRREAQERMWAATSAYDAAKQADDERTREIRSAPERAAVEATRRILAKYADEVLAETDSALAEILAAMPTYTRPAILDAPPPSRTWSDYLETE